MLAALKEQAKPKAAARPLLGKGLPAVLAVVEALRDHPASDQVSEAGSVRRRRETFRDLDIIATATDAQALIDAFTGFDWVAEVEGEGRDEGDGDLVRGLPVRPPGRAAGVLRQPAPALHRLEGAQRRDARGGAAPRPLDLRVRRRRGRERRGAHVRGRGGALRVARLPVHPARAARERRRARGGPPQASSRPWSRSRTSAATSTRTRPGRRTGRARWRRWRRAAKARGYAYLAVTDHSHYLRDGKLAAQAQGARRR